MKPLMIALIITIVTGIITTPTFASGNKNNDPMKCISTMGSGNSGRNHGCHHAYGAAAAEPYGVQQQLQGRIPLKGSSDNPSK
jgi:hypothetical protein